MKTEIAIIGGGPAGLAAPNGGVSNDQYTGAMIAADHIRKFPEM